MAENTTGKRKFVRKPVMIFTGVRVNVPAAGQNTQFFQTASFTGEDGTVVTIPDRWQCGFLAKAAIYADSKLVDKTIGYDKDGHPINIKVKAGGKLVKKAVICSRNFYGISEADLGKSIVATVEIFDKVEIGGAGESFRMIDITKTDNVKTSADLKIVQNGGPVGYQIPGSDFWIQVVERKHAEKKELAKAA
jgi:hypothetical protein